MTAVVNVALKLMTGLFIISSSFHFTSNLKLAVLYFVLTLVGYGSPLICQGIFWKAGKLVEWLTNQKRALNRGGPSEERYKTTLANNGLLFYRQLTALYLIPFQIHIVGPMKTTLDRFWFVTSFTKICIYCMVCTAW